MSTLHRVGSRPIVTWLAMAAVSLSATIWTAPAAAQPQKEKVEFTVDVAEDFALFTPTLVKPTDTQPERGSFFVTEGQHLSSGHDSGRRRELRPEQQWLRRSVVLPRRTPRRRVRDSGRRVLGGHGTAVLPAR